MLPKRNMLTLALIASGLCISAGIAQAASADASSPPVHGSTTAVQQSEASQTQSTPDNVSAKKTGDTTSKKQKQELAKNLQAITVTGFAGSVQKSIDYQRYADTIQNVVTSADIGGLPDQSIADSLTRLPGVAAERISGQASQINIRGLSGNFIATTLDGREQPSTSGSNYINFDQYPSELIDMATVYKTSQASLIEGGVGGTIALQTTNPLDSRKEQSLNIDARGSYNDHARDVGVTSTGYRLSVAWQGKFLNDTLGVGLGFADLYQPHVSEQFVGESYDSSPFVGTTMPSIADAAGKTTVVGAQGQNVYVPDGIQLQQNGGTERRRGYLSTLVWKPTDHLQLTGDAFFSKFNNGSFGYGYRSQKYDYGNTIITNPVLAPNGALTGATVTSNPNGAQGNQFSNETTADNYTTTTNVFSGGLNLKWENGPWHVDADASMSRASSNEINVDTTADPYDGLGTGSPTLMAQSVTYQLRGGNVGSASFGNQGIYTNLGDMALSRYGVYPYVYHDRNKALRVNVKYDFTYNPVFSAIEVGAYANNHTYRADRSAYIYGSEWNVSPVAGEPPLTLDSSNATVRCWQGQFGGMPCFLKLNGPAILAAHGITATPLKTWANNWTYIQSGTVDEKARDFFIMGDIDTTLFGHSVTGNVGIRVAHTSQYSDGLQQVGNGAGVAMVDQSGVASSDYAPLHVGKSYTDYLPSFNLVYHLTDNDQIRAAAAKVLSHPPIDKMLAGSGSWVDSGTYNVWGGTSPLLNPLRARQYDLDYEHYFDDSTGAFTAGVFFKSITSFIQSVQYDNFDFASVGIPVPINPNTQKPYANGVYQTSYNAKGGLVRGAELSFTKTRFLPGLWSGLGVALNYAYTQSPVKQVSTIAGPPQMQGLPGLSRRVASASLFYDNGGAFSANVTGNYRSSFVSDSQMSVTNQIVYFAPETIWDAQFDYKINRDFIAEFQVLNLSNAPTRTYFGNPSQTGTIQYFGRTFYGGFKVKF